MSLVCIRRGLMVVRLERKKAEELVKAKGAGWKYCPKADWRRSKAKGGK